MRDYKHRRQILCGTRGIFFLTFCLVLGLDQAQAQQTITYTNGENNTSTITITGTTTPTTLEVDNTDSATQSGNPDLQALNNLSYKIVANSPPASVKTTSGKYGPLGLLSN